MLIYIDLQGYTCKYIVAHNIRYV